MVTNRRRLPRTVVILAALMLGLGSLVAAARALIPAAELERVVNGIVILDAVLYDGQALNDKDEAVAVRNISAAPVDIGGYGLTDGSASIGTVSEPTVILPGQAVWLAYDAAAFAGQFGFSPERQLSGWPGFTNSGDEVILVDSTGAVVDSLVYADGDSAIAGWAGPALEPYRAGGNFAAEGQVLYRIRDQSTGQPIADTDSAADWAQSLGDVINGRKVRYPGWDSERYFTTRQITATGTLTIAVAPDNSYAAVTNLIASANERIRLASLTLENLGVAQALADAAASGVDVKILLEGGPAGGISDQERYGCLLIETSGGACWFMIADGEQRIHDRYRFMHAKYIVVDGQTAAISTENFSPDSLPDDDKSDGTRGRRGVILMLHAPMVAAHLEDVFNHDLDTAHSDIRRWERDDPNYGAPPPGFVPEPAGGGVGYTLRYPMPAVVLDTFGVELIQSPENSLRDADALLGLIGRAAAGDTLLVQQLVERPYWGDKDLRNALSDPNPRLEAYIAAARRGAIVRLVLDDFFDDPRLATSNAATCREVNRIALAENLNLQCAVANPTLMGIHNKMVLARIDGRGYVHVGSLNGTELSHKGNREVAIQIQSDTAYAYLAAMFERDRPHVVYMPVAARDFRGPADHLLITEVYYDPPGLDDKEFIEIGNPLPTEQSLSGYSIGDAVRPEDFEDVRVFPPGTILPARSAIVVAFSATAFQAEFGFAPDFEIVNSSADVPDLVDEPGWGDPAALLQLGNSGDEVVLRRGSVAVDVVVYGDGAYDDLVACALLAAPNKTLERFPYWRDANDCPTDFRGWPFPSPGQLP